MSAIKLTVKEIHDLALATGLLRVSPHPATTADDMEAEYVITAYAVEVIDDDGQERTYQRGAYMADYPEEGMHPLGKVVK